MKDIETYKKLETAKLLDAVKEGDLRLVRKALSNGASLNGNGDVTPLGYAIQTQNRSMVRFLLNQGADVDKPHLEAKPIVHAIQSKNPEVAEELLFKGANPNETIGIHAPWDKYQIIVKTPLIIAVEEGAFEVAQKLIKHGADPMKFVWQNENAFVTAVDCNRGPEWIKLLKKTIQRPITRQGIEAAKRTLDEVRMRQRRYGE